MKRGRETTCGSNREEEELSFNGGFFPEEEEDGLSPVAGQLNSNFGRLHSPIRNNSFFFLFFSKK